MGTVPALPRLLAWSLAAGFAYASWWSVILAVAYVCILQGYYYLNYWTSQRWVEATLEAARPVEPSVAKCLSRNRFFWRFPLLARDLRYVYFEGAVASAFGGLLSLFYFGGPGGAIAGGVSFCALMVTQSSLVRPLIHRQYAINDPLFQREGELFDACRDLLRRQEGHTADER